LNIAFGLIDSAYSRGRLKHWDRRFESHSGNKQDFLCP
jgi:hypothetical protein